MNKQFTLLLCCCIVFITVHAQTDSLETPAGAPLRTDSVTPVTTDTLPAQVNSGIQVKDEQVYHLRNGLTLVYPRPKPFGFITDLPRDGWQYVKNSFAKESIKPWIMIAGATGVLLALDQPIADELHRFSDRIHYHRDNSYKTVWEVKIGSSKTSLLRIPNNLNSAFYQLGQGYVSLLVGAGLFTYGKIANDYRSRSTASQLLESFFLMGASTQLVKRISGRQSPFMASNPGGNWHPFPSFGEYQKNTPNYDAFPSGHLATLMSSVTILAQNYPESRFIKPIGYSLVALLGLSMINNDVHWASDYPLALGMGYLSAKTVANRSRKLLKSIGMNKNDRASLSFSLVRLHNQLIPGFIYSF
ncbi:phosphatase PAP2 family protein [Niabella sp. CC-SYL272]|uniref:phosphatase PAP2 family protein n=1 Tax=Niabella agricola TaxID=2891571 RepID=UPI001F163C73|nr:phosphatase PAP2 family protein [Niabella agricola]MCF3111751.1 phosphatase PAP2 family protein [Niabella agricola]